MKKTLLFLPLIVIILVIFTKCKHDSINKTQDNALQPETLSLISLKLGANPQLSAFSKNFGLSDINTNQADSGKLVLKLKGKAVNVNGNRVNLSDDLIEISTLIRGEQFLIKDNKRHSYFKFNLKTNQGSIAIHDKVFPVNDAYKVQSLNAGEKLEYLKLIVLAVEVFDKGQIKRTATEWNTNQKTANRYDSNGKISTSETTTSCYRYNFTVEFSKAAALDQAGKDEIIFLRNHRDCRKVGEIDVTCAFTFTPCIATNTFTCNGATCDLGVITE
ncbi:MAG: hypothetical protein ABIN91_04210 [Mucilaginibacter sp.]|uniref:hypothetical protein n=1 Tax=Mucilaginibacter sp. TaxID=1882438 RepID=UPI0032666994